MKLLYQIFFWRSTLWGFCLQQGGRRLSSYKKFAFGSPEVQQRVAQQIRNFHTPLEQKRGFVIPAEAYRDVLMMIIDMGERTYELFHGPLSPEQRLEYFEMCRTMGQWMDIPNIPQSYEEYLYVREESLQRDYRPSEYAEKLFQSYRSILARFAITSWNGSWLCSHRPLSNRFITSRPGVFSLSP